MKKFFVLFSVLCLLGLNVFAQEISMDNVGTVFLTSEANGVLSDTLANATTDKQSAKTPGAFRKISFHAVGTKLSGTVSVTGTLKVSNDGVNYVAHPTASTISFTDLALQSKVIEVSDFDYMYAQMEFVGSGTQSVKIATKIKWIRSFEK